MTQPQNKKTVEDLLADYTDRILAGGQIMQDEATFAPDPELRALQQASLRLRDAFGTNDPDEEVIQRMQRNAMAQWRQHEGKTSQTAWQRFTSSFKAPEKKWQSQRSRQRFSMALSFAVLTVLLLATLPFLNDLNTNQPGASGQNPSAFVLVVIGILILLAMWLFRRKP